MLKKNTIKKRQIEKITIELDIGNNDNVIFKAIDTTSLMARPIIKLTIKPMALKQKQGQPKANNTNKQAKKNSAIFDFCYVFGIFLKCK